MTQKTKGLRKNMTSIQSKFFNFLWCYYHLLDVNTFLKKIFQIFSTQSNEGISDLSFMEYEILTSNNCSVCSQLTFMLHNSHRLISKLSLER
jgi:hypothetical protein